MGPRYPFGVTTTPAAERAAIDTVLLDAGGVLLLPHHDIIVEHVLGDIGVEVDADFLDRAHYHGAHSLTEWPADDEALYERWNHTYLEHLGVETTDENLERLGVAFKRFDMWTRVAPGAREGLRAIAATGVKMAIVSNADGQVEQILRETELCQVGPGPGVEMGTICDSTVVGYSKPDPTIFEIALDRLEVGPDRAVHVGDIVGADVKGALAAGVRPLHFDPHRLCPSDEHEHVASLTEVAELVTATPV